MRRDTTELEDQLLSLLRSEPAYAPSTCASSHRRRCGWTSPADGASSPFSPSPSPAASAVPHDEWRARIADWSYRVVDHFRYDREVVSVSMNFFDRFLVLTKADSDCDNSGGVQGADCDEEIDSRTYQLAAMTALYLAVKLHGEQPDEQSSECSESSSSKRHRQHCVVSPAAAASVPADRRRRRRRRRLRLLSFVELSRGQFNVNDITGMERRMLGTLRWRVNPPTPMVFVSYLLRLLPSSPPPPPSPSPSAPSGEPSPSRGYFMTESEYLEDLRLDAQHRHDLALHVLHELARYIAELSVCLSDVSTAHDPSSLAFAAVLVSAECLTREALSTEVRGDFLRDVADLSPKLHRDDANVIYLMGRIRETFLPELLADGDASCADARGSAEGAGHPIAIAREAGLLNADALYGPGSSSSFARPISSACEYGGYDYSRHDEMIQRSSSARCVIEEAESALARGEDSVDTKRCPPRSSDLMKTAEEERHDSPVSVLRRAALQPSSEAGTHRVWELTPLS